MKKHSWAISAVIGLAIVGLLVFFVTGKEQVQAPAVSETNSENSVFDSPEKENEQVTDSENVPKQTIVTINQSNVAWLAFESYLQAADNHDLLTIQRLAHSLSPTCKAAIENPENQNPCFDILDTFVNATEDLKQSDFPNVWSDAKQIILFSDPIIRETDDNKESRTMVMYFTIDSENQIKILGLNLRKSFKVKKIGFTPEMIDSRLEALTKDTDKDGLEDSLETCIVSENIDNCTETDPNDRDSNDNGWWDGIEALFR